ncbi:cartilage matrix protein-like isoform X2 [Ostrea edulis]|uniref:cartilage matrix protein-like isoform X2 n=1 Tax=Ostrea edulis TaxID=37623 RepID=UPI0024AF45EB|nr:cartilage matrix protein-like isoform X2 [Ostrea edulis]
MSILQLFSVYLLLGIVRALFKAECDLVPADFVFLLDSSGSETSRGFKTQLAFISNFTSNFEVGPDKAQFAAVTFSTSVYKNFYLNEHQDQASVLDAINKIAYRDGETYTDLGLNYVRQNVLTVCGDYPADIAFLIDSSGSESGSNFENERNFISMVASEFSYGYNDTMIAVSQFATVARTDIFFTQYPDKTALMEAIARISWMNGESNTHLGLRELAHNVFHTKHMHVHGHHHGHQSVTYGPRSQSTKIAVVLTDGQSLEPLLTRKSAATLHAMGVEVFAIGMGRHVDSSELLTIASDKDHIYQVPTTNDLESIHTKIVDAICKLKVPPPTTTPMPTTTKLPTTTVKQACGQKPADIVFLLDASESEKATGFAKEIEFVYNFARKFHIGPDNVQFGSVTFSSGIRNDFYLNTYHNRHDVLNAIQKIAYMQGGTNTSFGIQFVRENSFEPQNGGRQNATRIVIVITDGQSADPAATKHEAQLLHQQGVQVYAVGVGSQVDNSELKAISSDGTPILVGDFSLLHDIQASLETAACHGGT